MKLLKTSLLLACLITLLQAFITAGETIQGDNTSLLALMAILSLAQS